MRSAGGREINLNRLVVFASIVSAGSFTAAARELGLTKAMVSQHLARLEEELGITLMLRTSRKMSLTEAGLTFHPDCVRILAETQAAIERISQDRQALVGTLRLTSTTDYGVTVLGPALAEFMRRYPKLYVELVLSDEIRDLVAERFDLSIRVGWLRDSSAHAMRLAQCRRWVVASPTYLALRGTPREPGELSAHDWIAAPLLPAPSTLTFIGNNGSRHAVRVRPVAEVNSASAIRELILNHVGLSALPEYLVADDIRAGRLALLLGPDYRLRTAGIYAVYPSQRAPAKVRLLIDHLRQRLVPGPE
ncbi:LysR family transcriptional regulator [Pendulispora brunnea]|uniref:LysR family transcriptional regulator n=1 Tax=Pendulispora brunnea TaxID=2905690 RepID=A0ABZ2K6L3_9BACT